MTAKTLAPEHDSFIAWPSGMGQTNCSALYAKTADDYERAGRLAAAADEDEDWDAWQQHSAREANARVLLDELRDQGHLGEREVYARPDPVTALLGGASMTAYGAVYHNDTLVGHLNAATAP